jgi:hypothetical protein
MTPNKKEPDAVYLHQLHVSFCFNGNRSHAMEKRTKIMYTKQSTLSYLFPREPTSVDLHLDGAGAYPQPGNSHLARTQSHEELMIIG